MKRYNCSAKAKIEADEFIPCLSWIAVRNGSLLSACEPDSTGALKTLTVTTLPEEYNYIDCKDLIYFVFNRAEEICITSWDGRSEPKEVVKIPVKSYKPDVLSCNDSYLLVCCWDESFVSQIAFLVHKSGKWVQLPKNADRQYSWDDITSDNHILERMGSDNFYQKYAIGEDLTLTPCPAHVQIFSSDYEIGTGYSYFLNQKGPFSTLSIVDKDGIITDHKFNYIDGLLDFSSPEILSVIFEKSNRVFLIRGKKITDIFTLDLGDLKGSIYCLSFMAGNWYVCVQNYSDIETLIQLSLTETPYI